MNTDTLKNNLAEIESKIKAIAGYDIDHSDRWTSCKEKRIQMCLLLESRRHILNKMFQPSEQNMLRFKAVNARLYTLTRQLHSRVNALESKLSLIINCPVKNSSVYVTAL